MSFKTTIVIIVTIALTLLIIQNPEPVSFTIFYMPVVVPRLVMLTAMSVGGFLLGVLVSRPRKIKQEQYRYDDDEDDDRDDDRPKGRYDHLSDEDRDYIS
jgi:uncharacterized integral membrane protein